MATSTLPAWRKIPLPFLAVLGVVTIILIVALSRWLGGTSTWIASVLWLTAAIGLLYSTDRLPWVDRYTFASRALSAYTSRPLRARAPAKEPLFDEPSAIPDITELVGLDHIRDRVDGFVQSRSFTATTIQPATMVLLVGKRGTGKSIYAQYLAASLFSKGIVQKRHVVTISESETPGLADSYGLSADASANIDKHIQAALDGILVIEDLDRLIFLAGGAAISTIGSRLLTIARKYPGRLFVIGTGSSASPARLDPGKRWLGQLSVHQIDFEDLKEADLRSIFSQLLRKQSYSLAANAEVALKNKIRDLRGEGGDDFDNAYAIHRLVDSVLQNRGTRLRLNPTMPSSDRNVIIAEDIRNTASIV